MSKNIDLYTTYFLSNSEERQNELDECLLNNINNKFINNIFIFTESFKVHSFLENKYKNKKIKFIFLNHIPTYKDWIVFSKKYSNKNSISIFSNSDICFDESILNLNNYLVKPKSLVCASRYENGQLIKNPHWSQDVWALCVSDIENIDFCQSLSIQTGIPRCDNKLAYFFCVNGWDLYNPKDVKCVHKHESKIRNYEKKDKVNIGALAFVHPCDFLEPSKIEIFLMPLSCKNIINIKMDDFLCICE